MIYKSLSGDVFRKSDDPRLVAMAKRADEAEKRANEAAAKAYDAQLEKRADDELGHLPGDSAVKVALLKAVDGIADLMIWREKAGQLLKANDSGLAKAFETAGSAGNGIPVDAKVELDNLAKAYATEHEVPYAKAYVAVLETERGAQLYEKAQ